MARKVETIVTLTDDLDGGKADVTVAFGCDSLSYEIDLSKRNAAALEKLLVPYVAAARKAPRVQLGQGRSASTRTNSRAGLSDVRSWAKEQGLAVSERGRIARSVQAAYDAAH